LHWNGDGVECTSIGGDVD